MYEKTDRKSRSLIVWSMYFQMVRELFSWVFHRSKIFLVEPRKKVSFYYFYLDYQLRQTLGSSVGFFFSVKLVAFAACTLDFLLHSQPLSPFLSCLFSPAKIEVKWKNDLGYVTTGKIYLWSLIWLLIPLQLHEGFFFKIFKLG